MRAVLSLIMVFWLAGCASLATTDYDVAAPFDDYQTWRFASASDESGKPGVVGLDDARIRDAIETAMAGESLSLAEAGPTDLMVRYRIEQKQRLETDGFSYGLGLGRGNFGFGLSFPPRVEEVKEGKLVVELVDRARNQVIWKGIGRRYLNEDQSPETRRDVIDEVIRAMFERYPPDGSDA
ncbi:uncharacterized protein DUF4136 [Tamilnaduibacter salinus]|uniref:Uncharacterized protein DUF4136 n=1 Tax=Tamilnaduibacter salinus TaxID=1484056 RepID=A0A2A2I245_9GAMM|nr:DUF4136 domain-containing protein [Tamilnaduibacter salinus]PAV25799.1 hypothetical protein CF392_09100 [Tamilnaduibacter salinus]PVY75780.1 uncharacterized protein DUF4136 [Tamilnaduibacter salinus]